MTGARSRPPSATPTPTPEQPPSRRTALAAICGSALAWGLGTVLSKAALDTALPPLLLLAVQLTASVTFLGLVTALRTGLPSLRWPTLRHGLPGLLEPGLAYLVGIVGLALTTAGNASVIGSTEPVLTALLAWLVLRERLTARATLLMAVALLGVLLVTGVVVANRGPLALLGDALVLLGVAFAAAYALTSARAVRHVAPLPLALLQHSWALLLTLVVCTVSAALLPRASRPPASTYGCWPQAAASSTTRCRSGSTSSRCARFRWDWPPSSSRSSPSSASPAACCSSANRSAASRPPASCSSSLPSSA